MLSGEKTKWIPLKEALSRLEGLKTESRILYLYTTGGFSCRMMVHIHIHQDFQILLSDSIVDWHMLCLYYMWCTCMSQHYSSKLIRVPKDKFADLQQS